MKDQKTRRPPWAMRLVSARVRTGLSASAFAKKLGFSQQRYDHYEQGKSEPNIAGWNLLKREFGSEIYFILTGDKLWRDIGQRGPENEIIADTARAMAQIYQLVLKDDLIGYLAGMIESARATREALSQPLPSDRAPKSSPTSSRVPKSLK